MSQHQYYYCTKPSQNELVLVLFNDYKESHISGKLVHFPDCEVFLSYNDATKKRKVNSWNKIVPLNKEMVARVEGIDGDSIQVSLNNLYDNKNESEEDTRKRLMLPFLSDRMLITILKKICYEFKLDYNTLWSNLIYKIDKKRRDEYDPENLPSLYNYCLDEKENLDIFFNEADCCNISSRFQELLNSQINKTYKFVSQIEIVSNGGIENTITAFKSALNNIKFEYTLKYISAPIYYFESSSDDTSEDDHKTFIKNLEFECNKFNPKSYVRCQKIAEKVEKN